MKIALAAVGLALWATAFPALARDPRGETARFNLDKNGNRTTSMIKDGTITTTVTSNTRVEDGKEAVDVKMSYAFRVVLLGSKTGTKILPTPLEYWEDGFMERLRETGTYETPHFKVKHEGRADARTLLGVIYPACDILHIYDVDAPDATPLTAFAYAMIQKSMPDVDWGKATFSDIENLQIRAHVFPGIPALGAVKIDVTGVMSGKAFKAGADYVPAR